MRTNDSIRGAKDLAGKKVSAGLINSVNYAHAREWLQRNGVDPGSVQFLEIPFPQMADALFQNRLDAVWNVEPFLTFMVRSGNARVIAYPYQENVPRMDITCYLAKESWVKANADVARRFKRAIDRATTDLINASKEERDDFVAKYTGAKPEVVAAMNLPEYVTELNVPSLKANLDIAVRQKLAKPFDLDVDDLETMSTKEETHAEHFEREGRSAAQRPDPGRRPERFLRRGRRHASRGPRSDPGQTDDSPSRATARGGASRARCRASGFAASTIPVPIITCPRSGWSRPGAAATAPMSQYPVCEAGEWNGDFFQVKPLPDEVIVTKHRYGAFEGTDLDLVLRSRGIRSVIMTGVATNVCVETTARQAFMRDYYVVFTSDCSATFSQAAHDATLYNIDQFFGEVASSEQIMACWPSAQARLRAAS